MSAMGQETIAPTQRFTGCLVIPLSNALPTADLSSWSEGPLVLPYQGIQETVATDAATRRTYLQDRASSALYVRRWHRTFGASPEWPHAFAAELVGAPLPWPVRVRCWSSMWISASARFPTSKSGPISGSHALAR